MSIRAALAPVLLALLASTGHVAALRPPPTSRRATSYASTSRRSFVAVGAAWAFATPASASVIEDAKAFEAATTVRKVGTTAEAVVPRVTAKSKSINLVAKVTVTAMPAAGDSVELVYIKDAVTGTVLGASKGSNTLITSIDKGKMVVPIVAYRLAGCWEGAPVELVPGFSLVE